MFSSSLHISSSAQRLSILSPTSAASEVTSLLVPSPIGVEFSASFRFGCEGPSLSNFVSADANSASEVTGVEPLASANAVRKETGLRSPLSNAARALGTTSRRSGERSETGSGFSRIVLRAGDGRGTAVCCGTRGSFGRRGCCWKYKESLLGRMEMFAPQLMDTAQFRFLSEYHTTPALRAVHDNVSPVCFFGFGQAKAPVVEVVQAGDPVLHEPCEEVRVEEIGSARVERIINDMVATMRNAPGVGLAAPQIGVPLQIIVLEDTKELMSYVTAEECEVQQRYPFDLLVIINPKLKTKSNSGSAIFFEGCLSVDGYRALVKRDLEVEVTGLGRDGKPICVKASGWKARILQHECDHLVGELYVDKMIPRTYRTKDNLRLPLPAGCPEQGVCNH